MLQMNEVLDKESSFIQTLFNYLIIFYSLEQQLYIIIVITSKSSHIFILFNPFLTSFYLQFITQKICNCQMSFKNSLESQQIKTNLIYRRLIYSELNYQTVKLQSLSNNKMGIKKIIKNTIIKCDIFSQKVTFRYNDEPQYQSFTGGCISILLIIAFIGIFATTLLRTVDKQYINFNQTNHDEQNPSYFQTTFNKTFMFAIGMDNIDLNSGQRYFDIYMQFKHYHGNSKDSSNVPLIPCERETWQQLGYGSAYDKLNFTRWLCPVKGTQLQLEGKFSSESFKFYKIAAKQCNSSLNLSRPCANQSTINSYLNVNEAFNFNYYFINTIINPGDDVYLTTYLEDVNFFPFSQTNGVKANLFISSYTIQTDQSLWPMEDINVDSGGIVFSSSQVMNYQVRLNEYMKLYLRKSPISLSIQRSFRKVDDTFSYIGGLFSTILVVFGLVNFYNQLSYEISISKSCYYFDKNDPFDGDHFNILIYSAYLIFSLFDKIGIQLPWPRFQRLHKFLEQGRKHLDIKLIMQKILYAQKLGMIVLNKNKHKALLLSQPFTLSQAEEIRKDLQFYKQIRKKFFPNGELLQENQQITTKEIFNKTSVQLGVLPNDSNSYAFKIFPADESAVIEGASSQFIEMEGSKQKKGDLTKQEEFSHMDTQMRDCLQKVQEEANNNDEIAKKILQKMDDRVKKRYLGTKKNLGPLQVSMRRKNQILVESPNILT